MAGMGLMPRKQFRSAIPASVGTGDEELLTTTEVAERLKITRQTVQRLIKAGKLKASRIGRDWRVKRNELETFLKATENR